jgi:hypothetical protein
MRIKLNWSSRRNPNKKQIRLNFQQRKDETTSKQGKDNKRIARKMVEFGFDNQSGELRNRTDYLLTASKNNKDCKWLYVNNIEMRKDLSATYLRFFAFWTRWHLSIYLKRLKA